MKILVAADDSPCSADAVLAVTAERWPPGAVFKVLTVVEGESPQSLPCRCQLTGPAAFPRCETRRQAPFVAARLAASLEGAGLAADFAVREGDPCVVIAREAKEWDADLIVVGARDCSAAERWLLARVAGSAVRNAPCRVQIFRQKPVS